MPGRVGQHREHGFGRRADRGRRADGFLGHSGLSPIPLGPHALRGEVLSCPTMEMTRRSRTHHFGRARSRRARPYRRSYPAAHGDPPDVRARGDHDRRPADPGRPPARTACHGPAWHVFSRWKVHARGA
jgi:hypothetical protein